MRDRLRALIVEHFMFGGSGDDLRDDESLVDSGVLDSTGVAELVAYLEEAFGIAIEDQECVPQNLDNIARIEAFLIRKGVAVA